MTTLRLEIDPDVRVLMTDSGAVLLHLGRGTYCGLNPAGAVIWKSIEQGRTTAEILRELEASFPNIGAERLAKDLSLFLEQLPAKGLARVR